MLPIEERRPSSTQHSHRQTKEKHSDQDRGDQGGGPLEVLNIVAKNLTLMSTQFQ